MTDNNSIRQTNFTSYSFVITTAKLQNYETFKKRTKTNKQNNNNQEKEKKYIETSKYCNKVNPNKASTIFFAGV
jgi:hypothetical protein